MLCVTSLLHRFAAGSSTAFGDLANAVAPFLGRLAGRTRVSELGHGADDLANIVLFRLWDQVRTGAGLRDQLTGSQGLLRALALLTRQCAGTLWRDAHRAKRDVSRTVQWADGAGQVAPDPQPIQGTFELPAGLTERQRQIAGLLAEGWLPCELHERLACSESTARREVRNLRAAIEARAG